MRKCLIYPLIYQNKKNENKLKKILKLFGGNEKMLTFALSMRKELTSIKDKFNNSSSYDTYQDWLHKGRDLQSKRLL